MTRRLLSLLIAVLILALILACVDPPLVDVTPTPPAEHDDFAGAIEGQNAILEKAILGTPIVVGD